MVRRRLLAYVARQLAGVLVEELRQRRVLLPSPLVLEAIVRCVRQRAEAL